MALLETLTDNFDDNSFDTGKWASTLNGGVVSEQNQRLELIGADNGDNPIVRSVSTYDLTASYAYARVSNWASGTWSWFGAEDGSGDQYYLQLHPAGTLYFKKNIATVETQIGTGISYSSSTHAWFRIRESSGTIFADTATSSASNPPSGGDWTNQWSESVDAGFDKTTVKAYLSHYTDGTNLATHFDGYNTAATVAGGGAAVRLVGASGATVSLVGGGMVR